MKLAGEALEREIGYFKLNRKVEVPGEPGNFNLKEMRIKVQSLPARWDTNFERIYERPRPPLQAVGKGDRPGQPDERNPKYMAELEEWETARIGKMALDCIIDPDVTWETPPPKSTDPRVLQEYWRVIYAEFTDGMARGELESFIMVVQMISTIGAGDVMLAEQDFFRNASGAGGVPAPEGARGEGDAGEAHDAVPGAPDLQGDALDLPDVVGSPEG